MQKFENDMQKFMQGISSLFSKQMNEKLFKLKSQNYAPKVEIQHQKREKGPRGNISNKEEPIAQAQIHFSQGYMPNP